MKSRAAKNSRNAATMRARPNKIADNGRHGRTIQSGVVRELLEFVFPAGIHTEITHQVGVVVDGKSGGHAKGRDPEHILRSDAEGTGDNPYLVLRNVRDTRLDGVQCAIVTWRALCQYPGDTAKT